MTSHVFHKQLICFQWLQYHCPVVTRCRLSTINV